MADVQPRYPLHFHRSVHQGIEHHEPLIDLLQVHRSIVQAPSLHQLPPDNPHFAGRREEIATAIAHIGSGPEYGRSSPTILAITGSAGVGKTALALHLTHQLKHQFGGAQLYVNLRGTERQPVESGNVIINFLRAWGIDDRKIPADLTARSRLLSSLMAQQRTLVVLDDVRDAAHIHSLIALECTCVFLITSRQLLTDLPDATLLPLTELSERESLELLKGIVGKDIVETELEASTSLVQRCDRLPLAITLISKTLQQQQPLDLAEKVAWLSKEQQRLAQRNLSHPTIRACFALSYQNLDAPVGQLLCLLGLLAETTFTPTTAAILLATEREPAEKMIHQLVEVGLLTPIGDDRFALIHEVIRLLVRAQLAIEVSTETRQAARLRLSLWYQQTVEKLAFDLLAIIHASSSKTNGKRGNRVIAVEQAFLSGALTWFDLERRSLLTAIEWAYQEDKWEIVLGFADSLSSVLEIHANCKDWEPALLLALEVSRTCGDRQREAQILNNLGNLSARQGNWKKAEEQYEQSRKRFDELNDSLREAQTLLNLSILYIQQGEFETTRSLWQSVLNKFPPDSPEQRTLKRWVESVDSYLLQDSEKPGDRQTNHGIFYAIGEIIKRLLSE